MNRVSLMKIRVLTSSLIVSACLLAAIPATAQIPLPASLSNGTYAITATAAPEPSSILLLGSGLLCLASLLRRRNL